MNIRDLISEESDLLLLPGLSRNTYQTSHCLSPMKKIEYQRNFRIINIFRFDFTDLFVIAFKSLSVQSHQILPDQTSQQPG